MDLPVYGRPLLLGVTRLPSSILRAAHIFVGGGGAGQGERKDGKTQQLQETLKGGPVVKRFPWAQSVKNPPAMRGTQVRSLGWEDPLKEDMATHSSILAQRIPIVRGAWWAIVYGVAMSWTLLRD